MKSSLFKFSVRDIAEIGVLCALAVVFDKFVKIPLGQTGGSINIATIPLFMIAYRHGWFKGLISAGGVFGLITCLLDGYGFQFFAFDYFIAFGCIGLAGLFGPMICKSFNKKGVINLIITIALVVLTVAIYCVIRTLSASVDSMIFYEYAFWPSVVYNISYIGPSSGIVAVVLCLLLPVFKSINQMYPTTFLKDIIEDDEEESKITEKE